MDSFKFWMKVKKGKAIIWYHLRYVRCLWKSKTPKELRGSVEEARGMMGSAVDSETCLASNFPLFWKEHWVSHIPSEPHHLQIIPEGVSLELCGVQLVSASKCYQAWTSDLKQPSFFFFQIPNEPFYFSNTAVHCWEVVECNGWKHALWSQTAWVQSLPLLPICCVVLHNHVSSLGLCTSSTTQGGWYLSQESRANNRSALSKHAGVH